MSTSVEKVLRQGGVPSKDLDKAVDAILDRLGEKKSQRYLASGKYASVFWLRKHPKKVLKITTDKVDADASELIRRRPQRGLVKVYDVFTIVPRKLWGVVS